MSIVDTQEAGAAFVGATDLDVDFELDATSLPVPWRTRRPRSYEQVRALIVVQRPAARQLLRTALRMLNFRIIHDCASVPDAMEHLKEAEVGLVLSDFNLSPVDGLEFLKSLRADARFVDLPFIMLAAKATYHRFSQALEAGVDAYLVTPFAYATLEAQIARALRAERDDVR